MVAILSLGMIHAARAQSLDIGGVELRLGQKVEEALRSLSPYQVQYTGGSWLVSQKAGKQHQLLGSISATANVLTFINKSYLLSSNEDAPGAYTRASKELRQRGGANCTTTEVEYSDGLVRAFDTHCGLYKLSYFMPSKGPDGTRYLTSISISIRSR